MDHTGGSKLIDPITLVAALTLGGMSVFAGVHLVPVGGASGAMATSSGIPTGTTQLAAGASMTGLIVAGMALKKPLWMILLAGGIGASVMITLTGIFTNICLVYGIGSVPTIAKRKKDPITGWNQEKYVTPGTEGHGAPTSAYISGAMGAFLGGVGGALIYWTLYHALVTIPYFGDLGAKAIAVAYALGMFFVNAVLASYNIGGTTEGLWDPKIHRLPRGIVGSLIVSFVIAILTLIIAKGGAF